jgi:PAS domain S-box-containing protein
MNEARLQAPDPFDRSGGRRAPGFVYDWNPATGHVTRTEEFAWVLGYGPGEVEETQRGWWALVHPDDLRQLLASMSASGLEDLERRLRDGGAFPLDTYAMEYRVRHRNGDYVRVWDRLKVLRDEAGQVTRVVGSTLDLSSRDQAEEHLREATARLVESEARFRMMADLSPAVMWVTDDAGGVEFVNRGYLDFFGVTAERVRGANWQPLVHPDDLPPYLERFRRAAESRSEFRAVARVRRADGTWRWLSSWGAPRFSSAGTFQGYVGSSCDITPLKEAELAELHARHEADRGRQVAEDATRLKDQFLAAVSHELRTPLGAITGWASMLENVIGNERGLRSGIAAIQRNAAVLRRLVDDLLDTARITSGRMRIERAPVDLGEVIENALGAVQPAASAKGVDIRLEVEETARHIIGDPTRLQQVVWNLLANAVKFTPGSGLVEVCARRAGDAVQITVADSGCGISEEFKPFVFDRFSQAEGTGSKRQAGLGLGLAIVRHLVELHGGEVTVSSDGADRGSTFTVTLPARAPHARASGACAPRRFEQERASPDPV